MSNKIWSMLACMKMDVTNLQGYSKAKAGKKAK
jgi:hypothetical protein